MCHLLFYLPVSDRHPFHKIPFSKKDYKSKMHLIELGLQWVENETGVKVLREVLNRNGCT